MDEVQVQATDGRTVRHRARPLSLFSFASPDSSCLFTCLYCVHLIQLERTVEFDVPSICYGLGTGAV
jgi:hypothetical protein